MSRTATLPAPDELDRRARAVLEAHWRPQGYTVPNGSTYPFAWLWDSCFHAIVWAHLGEPERALAELTHVFRTQDDSGFVPHVDYEVDPTHLDTFWGRPGSSSITQPPMYGHALAEMARRDIDIPSELVERATAGLRFLLSDRERDPQSGLITIVHPWESGADDSPRWDHWCPGGFDLGRWYATKGDLVASIVRGPGGAPLANTSFGAAPASFNALVVFNARELAVVGAPPSLIADAEDIAVALESRWDEPLRTWIDGGPSAVGSGRVRTLDALLGVLVGPRGVESVTADLLDRDHYGGSCGPAGVHRDESAFAPRAYWRGAAWPQLSYLFWTAALRTGARDTAVELGHRLVCGAVASGFAEHWDPDGGTPGGAVPQSWSTLAAVVRGTLDEGAQRSGG